MVWADAHNHLQLESLAGCREHVGECLINATREEDWAGALAVATAPGRHTALGIHPWFAHTLKPGWEERLRDLLVKYPAAAIGECGLDRKSRSCPFELQIPVFEQQLRLAREFKRPLTIHCVAAWGRLIEILKAEPPPANWLLHSFNGSLEISRQLVDMGAFFSISGSALHPTGEKILRVFRQLPPSRILLETDAPNQPPPATCVSYPLPGTLNHPLNLAAIGAAIATRLGFDTEAFAALTRQNFHRFIHPL